MELKILVEGLSMNLDDVSRITQIDQSGMINNIRKLPDQLLTGWNNSLELNIIEKINYENIFLGGFQENKIVIEILQLLISPYYSKPFYALKDNSLPDWSKTGNLVILKIDELTITDMETLISKNLRGENEIVALVTNNGLKTRFSSYPIFVIEPNQSSFSRHTIGYDVMFLGGILFQLGLIPDLKKEILTCQENLGDAMHHFEIDIQSSLNPAKRLAGQMVGRWVKIVSSGSFLPLAKYWNQQINQSAKTLAFFEDISDLVDHSINGIINPGSIVQQSLVVFIKSDLIEEKVSRLLDLTKEELMCYGIGTDIYQAHGSSLFSEIWNTILFGDYMAYYLAIAYQCDPEPLMIIEN